MDDERLESLIKRYIREALMEILGTSEPPPQGEGGRDNRPYRYPDDPGYIWRRELRHHNDRLDFQINRLAFFTDKLGSWSTASCRYDSKEIEAIKTTVESIEKKVP